MREERARAAALGGDCGEVCDASSRVNDGQRPGDNRARRFERGGVLAGPVCSGDPQLGDSRLQIKAVHDA
ncbi:hypothetical protein AWC21_02695 [Mycolicibacterium peregrinum]|nr:hypothetical protein AWC21_02695 [Mycolicibacterium peregrinum]